MELRRALITSEPMSSPATGALCWSSVAVNLSQLTTLRQVRGGSLRLKLKRKRGPLRVSGGFAADLFMSRIKCEKQGGLEATLRGKGSVVIGRTKRHTHCNNQR